LRYLIAFTTCLPVKPGNPSRSLNTHAHIAHKKERA